MKHRPDDKPPLRVLYCILDSRFGGPHRLAQAVAEQLRQYNTETVFLLGQKGRETWRPEGFASFSLKHLQCMRRHHPLLSFFAFCLFLPGNLVRIRRLIRSHRIDIVHIDGVTNLVPALAARWTRTPIVWLYNDHLPRWLGWILLPLVTALSSRVIVQGEKLVHARTKGRTRLRAKTTVLYSGVDPATFDPAQYDGDEKAKLREELALPSGCRLIGTVGNLNRFKGHHYFIEAAAQIKGRIAAVKFLVVGRELETDRSYRDQLQRLVAKHGLENDVIFTGFRSDIAGLLSILDVFVLASIRESCPLVVLEAMAMKVPVVATDVGAVSELILDRRTGLVVPPCDAGALAEAILASLGRPADQTAKIAEAARKRVESEFGIGTIARQQQGIYEAVRSGALI